MTCIEVHAPELAPACIAIHMPACLPTWQSVLARPDIRMHARRSSRQTSQPTIEKRRALDIACQLTRGLRHIHEAGYIHGDIKEGNLLCSGDTIKIADFGCARRLSDVNDWEYVPFTCLTAPC